MHLQASNCIPVGATVTLTRQSEVDSFPINYPGCDVVESGLTITGNNIVNLNGLLSVKRINELFYIDNNPNLVSLNGLNNLNYVKELNINNNNLLINLQGLGRLDSVVILIIYDNKNLVNFNGIGHIEKLFGILIANNNSLVNFTGLEYLKNVNGNFSVGNNPLLEGFYGLNNVYNIDYFQVTNNPLLKNFTGLESIRQVNNLSVVENNSLINFLGLDSVSIMLGLAIDGNSSLLNFNGLNNIVSIEGILQIRNNSSIINLEGFEKLETVQILGIYRNESLKNLVGIYSLSTVVSLFVINNNQALINLQGIESIKNIGSAGFQISYNNSLCNINNLNKSINSIDQNGFDLYINYNKNLTCCSILNNIVNYSFVRILNVLGNAVGCNDTTEIRIFPNLNCCSSKYYLIKDTICFGNQIIFNNRIITSAGIYYDTVVSNGLDSITILLLTVRPKSYQIINKDYCIGQTFTLSNGKIITTTGTYKDTIPNICDSIIEYRLNFLNNITTNVNATICKGKNYILPKGNLVSTTGIYKDTLRSAFNCDSIIITNLTVTNPIPFNNNISICSGKSYTLPNGNIIKTAGIYIDTIRKINTCDSIVVTNLTVTNPIPFNNNISICSGKSYTLPNGNIVKTSGIYIDTIRKINTCDSIVITNLTVNPYLQFAQTATVCLGKSYVLPNGKNANQTGVYKDTIQNVFGCDSIVTTNLTVTNLIPNNVNISICEGKTYTLPNGRIVSIAGIYRDTIKKINTCDSIVITNLSVIPNTFSVSLNSIDSIDAGTSITLQPTYNNQTAISWNWTPSANLSCTTCENPIAMLSQNAQYIVKAVAQNGCEDTAITTIFVRQLEIYVPAAFSPNNDNINDEFTVFATNLNTFSLKIFNRYGELVFESNDINTKWNGTYKGENCAVESYSYIIDATQHNNKQIHKQGTVLLVR